MHFLTEFLGFMAAIFTTTAYFPQVLKAWTTQKTEDLSWGLIILLSAGVGLWFVYGCLIHSAPLMIANAISLVTNAALTWIKWTHRRL